MAAASRLVHHHERQDAGEGSQRVELHAVAGDFNHQAASALANLQRGGREARGSERRN